MTWNTHSLHTLIRLYNTLLCVRHYDVVYARCVAIASFRNTNIKNWDSATVFTAGNEHVDPEDT